MARIHIVIIKYTLYAAMVFSAGLVIEQLARVKYVWKDDLMMADLVYNVSSPLMSRNYNKVLKKQYLKCFTQPAKPFCLLSADKRLEIFRSKGNQSPSVEEIEDRLRNITSDFPANRRRIHAMLVKFTQIMKAHHVNIILIEPSMLFCLLSLSARLDMLSTGFNPGRLLGSRNVVTVCVLNGDSKKLEEKNLTSEVISAGFKIIKFRKWIEKQSEKEFETVHYFFILEDVAMHVVIFFANEDHVWHSGLDPKEIDFEGLLFLNEGIYENFTLLPLNLAGTSISQLFLPHDIRQFMREIEFSKFVECRTNSSGVAANIDYPNLTKEQLITRVVIVLKELKAIFTPDATFLMLWSESLLGWYTECDIFHFSSNLNLALLYKNIKGINLTQILADNEFLSVENSTESNSTYGYKLDCHGLPINIYFIHEDDGLVWYKFNGGEDLVYKLPSFTMCSSEIYGQKVQVPCNVTEVLQVKFPRNEPRNSLPII